MAYLINFIHKIIAIAGFYPFQLVTLSLVIILFLFMKFLYNYKNVNTDYKIYYPKINILLVLIYFTVFILLIIYLRYIRFGFSIELILVYQKWSNLFHQVPILVAIILLQLIVIAMILLTKIKNLLSRALWKWHLFFYYTSFNNSIKRQLKSNPNPTNTYTEKEFLIYYKFIKKLAGYWSYENMIDRIVLFTVFKPYCKLTDSKEIPKILIMVTNFIFYNWTNIVLCIILLNDLYNGYILHGIFYYLPFYFVYSLWKNTTKTLASTDNAFNFIIYERYYETENVLYVNTTNDEEEILLQYIRQNFKSYLKLLSAVNNTKEWQFMSNFPSIFMQKHRFVKNDKGFFENTDGYFELKDIKSTTKQTS